LLPHPGLFSDGEVRRLLFSRVKQLENISKIKSLIKEENQMIEWKFDFIRKHQFEINIGLADFIEE
jgi:hypothetical protein